MDEDEDDENGLEGDFPWRPVDSDWGWLDLSANPVPVDGGGAGSGLSD